ncbi:uncharacterized protein A1O9_09835 [Exophiala aquamarina CBS 119918]|uniref:Alcohol dehydrogenase-like C-terminal domain-containing protein n=1 Tax=Exophiala aquamarina CBS 119918 TaxID=1182545 RepID=A0A072PEN9_9EURO|nr:uncharacterized protein A1O9_09835 [Exophiala aquamarina CBS 119918]KEF54040.1 hypothetical protein A1O9_09835 [Exophiala aquamarina CBS 119918]
MTKTLQHVDYEDVVVLLPLDGQNPGEDKTVLIWGASSCVGSCGVQLAAHAGYEIFGIASRRNHEMVKSLGAVACFDQSEPDLIEDIVQALKGKAVAGAFDANHNNETLEKLCEILHKVDQRKLIASISPGAEAKGTKGVKIITNFATIGVESEVPKFIWQWINKAMESNTIKYMPQPEIVGKGLNGLQKAVELLSKGVSAKKLVVSI